jgi:hypothetical protein
VYFLLAGGRKRSKKAEKGVNSEPPHRECVFSEKDFGFACGNFAKNAENSDFTEETQKTRLVFDPNSRPTRHQGHERSEFSAKISNFD